MSKKKRVAPTLKFTRDEKLGALIASSQLEGKLKVSRGKFNRYCKAFGLEKVSTETLQLLLDKIDEQSTMLSPTPFYNTYKSVLEHKLTLKDIFGRNYSDEEFTRKVTLLESPQAVNSQAIKDMQRESNKEHREVARQQILHKQLQDKLSEDLKHLLDNTDYKTPKKLTFNDKDDAIILNGSDWHIGYACTTYATGYSNTYNYEIFKNHWDKVLSYTKNLAKTMNIHTIYFNHIGDLIESTKMHPNQEVNTEFVYSEQVSKATDAVVKTLLRLQENFKVIFSLEVGNHDRIAFNAKQNDYNDSVCAIILDYVILLKENGLLPNVTIIDNRNDMHDVTLDIVGTKYLFTHGEKVKPAQKNNISNVNGLGNDIDILVYGHYHQFQVKSGDAGKLEIMLPVFKGYDNYARSISATLSPQGQLIIVQHRGQEPIMIPYMFNIGKQIEHKKEQNVIK